MAATNAAGAGALRRARLPPAGRRPGYYRRAGAAPVDALVLRKRADHGFAEKPFDRFRAISVYGPILLHRPEAAVAGAVAGPCEAPAANPWRFIPMTFAKTLASAAALMLTAAALQAQEAANPAVIFDLGGKFDRSFNQASFEGAERFKAETGIAYRGVRAAERRPARAGAAPLRRARPQPGGGRGLLLRLGHGDRRPGVSRHRLRHHRHGGRAAERALGGLQRA